MKDKANKARARTRREMKDLHHKIDSVLAARQRAGPTITRAGRRAVGKDGRSAQHILADAVHYIREIKSTAPQPAHVATAQQAMPRVHPQAPLMRDCVQWQQPQMVAIDDDTVRKGLLSSHSVACFLVEMPGWTLLDLSPGAKRVLGQSPFGDCLGQELTNGFVHFEDVAMLEAMWQRALASGASLSSRVRILSGSIREIGSRTYALDRGFGQAGHECGYGGSSGSNSWDHEYSRIASSSECGGFKLDHGIDPSTPAAFAYDALLDEGGDLWREAFRPGEGPHHNAEENYLAEPCVLPAGYLEGGMGWCGVDGNMSAPAAEPRQQPTSRDCSFQHQFVSLRAEVLCSRQSEDGRKLHAMLLAPLDTACSWLVGDDDDTAAIGRSLGIFPGSAPVMRASAGVRGPDTAERHPWGNSEWERQDPLAEEKEKQDLAATMAELNGVYKFEWDLSTPNIITPGDVRQWLSDLISSLAPALCTNVQHAPRNILDHSAGSGDYSSAVSALFQTVVNVTGAMSNWTVKTAINMLFKYAEFHVGFRHDEDGVPSVTLHMRASFLGVYSSAWTEVSRLRLDGIRLETLSAPGGLKNVSTLLKSRSQSLSIVSFWIARTPYRDVQSREQQQVLPEDGCWAGEYHGAHGREAGTARVQQEEGMVSDPHAATAPGGAFGWPSPSGSHALHAPHTPMRAMTPDGTDLGTGWYVQHMRTFSFDVRTRTVQTSGFLPGKGRYSFVLNKA